MMMPCDVSMEGGDRTFIVWGIIKLSNLQIEQIAEYDLPIKH